MTRTRWMLAVGLLLPVGIGGVLVSSGGDRPAAAAQVPVANTAPIEFGRLSATVSQAGTLTYRARPDGSPFAVTNQARGVYTQLPDTGAKVRCGDVLYRVDDKPVLLLCGEVPAYRALRVGMTGRDVRQLNGDLHRLGYDRGARLDPHDRAFTSNTAQALRSLQRRRGMAETGVLATADAVFLPEAVRVAKVTGQVGGPAGLGTPVLTATSGSLRVRVDLDPSQQGGVERGDRARIALPGNAVVTGRVEGLGRVAQASSGQGGQPASATVTAYVRPDRPVTTGGLDQAPVQVDITTKGVDNALSVPVGALVGRSGGGFAVEAVRGAQRRELVPVKLGLFDTGSGRVQVHGRLTTHDRVVVPST